MAKFTITLGESVLRGEYKNSDLDSLETQLSRMFGVHSIPEALSNEGIVLSRRFHIMLISSAIKDLHPEVKREELSEKSPVELRNAAKACIEELGDQYFSKPGKIETRGGTEES